MTPLFKQMIPTHQRIALNRLKRAMTEGSPVYTYEPGVLAAATTIDSCLRSQFPAAEKYDYMDYMKIVNNDAVDLEITLNGSGGHIETVPAGVIQVIRDQAFRQWRIENMDAVVATTAGAIRISMQREPLDADKAARLNYGQK